MPNSEFELQLTNEVPNISECCSSIQRYFVCCAESRFMQKMKGVSNEGDVARIPKDGAPCLMSMWNVQGGDSNREQISCRLFRAPHKVQPEGAFGIHDC